MQHFYSPHTGELIVTRTPADWMESTDEAPPAFDAKTASCYRRSGAWVVVQAETQVNPRIAVIDAEILALEAQGIRPIRDALAALAAQQEIDVVDAAKIIEISDAIKTLRVERAGL